MRSPSTDPAVVPPPHGPLTAPAVPSLDALRQMTSIPDRRVAFRAVDWAFYEHLVDSIPEFVRIHVDYDGKDLEIMGTGPKHERIKELLSYLVRIHCEELGIACKGLGETTWKRPEVARGLEADLCYYFRPEKLAAAQAAQLMDSDDIADYPNPDLAIEIDISAPLTDRAGIYAALAVAEIWRYVGDQVIIERLGDDRGYHTVAISEFLPIRAEEVWRWVGEEDSRDELAWPRRLREWVRAELAPRQPR